MYTSLRALAALPCFAATLTAQLLPTAARCAGGALTTTLPGGLADENARAQGLRAGAPWSLARASTDAAKARMLADSSAAPFRVAAVLPEFLVTSQQSFPMPANDGPLWGGKGLSYSVTGGVAVCGQNARWGALIAPTYWYAENAAFDLPTNPQIVPPRKGEYSEYASHYYYMPRSLDAPRRFGPNSIAKVEAGAFALWVRAPRVEFGLTTAPQWWGPGLHNALLLSSQAAGVPRLYVQTSRPIHAAGELEAHFFLGGLSYSPYYRDPQPLDSSRSLAGLAVIWRPSFEKNLSIGVARLVAAPIVSNAWIDHLIDPLVPVGAPNELGRGDSTEFPGRDQLFSFFADWRLPADGTEIWFEWARAQLPTSVRDFFESPNHTQALTLGLQHVEPMRWTGWTWRVGAEYSQTNQSSTFRERPTGSWYTSRSVDGGFSQKGQILGAMIGPGSVTQRLNLDIAGPRRSVGVFAYRIKWDDDSFYTIPRPNGNGLCKHDVSLALGARGSTLTPAGWFEASLTSQNRLNLYWQALGLCFNNEELQIDKRSVSLEIRFHPRVR